MSATPPPPFILSATPPPPSILSATQWSRRKPLCPVRLEPNPTPSVHPERNPTPSVHPERNPTPSVHPERNAVESKDLAHEEKIPVADIFHSWSSYGTGSTPNRHSRAGGNPEKIPVADTFHSWSSYGTGSTGRHFSYKKHLFSYKTSATAPHRHSRAPQASQEPTSPRRAKQNPLERGPVRPFPLGGKPLQQRPLPRPHRPQPLRIQNHHPQLRRQIIRRNTQPRLRLHLTTAHLPQKSIQRPQRHNHPR